MSNLGRNANNGDNAGFFYWNLNNLSSNDNVNIGRQVSLFFLTILNTCKPCLWAKHKAEL